MSKFLLLFILPLQLFAQSGIESKHLSFSLIGSAKTKGASIQRVWMGENRFFQSFGVEVHSTNASPFLPLTIGAGYSFGSLFVVFGAGAGSDLKGRYGAFAEAGAGLKVSILKASVSYRGGSWNSLDKEGELVSYNGVYFRCGVEF